METRIEKLLDGQLSGLRLPPSHTLFSGETDLVVILLLFGALALISFFTLRFTVRYLGHRKKPAVVATRQLKALQNANPANNQTTALAITQILRHGLNVKRLDKYQAKQTQQWNTFKSQLNSASYSSKNSEETQVRQLFTEAHGWLSKAADEQSRSSHV